VVYLVERNKVAALEQYQRIKKLDEKMAREFYNTMFRDNVLSVTPR
jgi:hypothetical protein